jgi:tetratricopeptide (TPR) repeat protein
MVHYPLVRIAMSDADNPSQPEPPTLQALFDRVEQMVRWGRPSDALPILDHLAEQVPTEPQVYFLRAQATRQAGGVTSAFVDVRAALALSRRLGVDLHPMQVLSDELKRELAEEVPLLAVARATAILRRLILSDKQRAAEELAESLGPHVGSYRSLLLLAVGLSRMSRGRPDLAIAELEAAVEQFPSLWPAAYACGQALLEVGDTDGALRAFAYTAAQRRESSAGFMQSEAEDLLSSVPRLVWGAHRFAFERASLLHSLGRSEEALTVLDELIAEESDAADAHLSKAVVLTKLGRLEEALAAVTLAESTLRPEDRSQEPDDPLDRLQRLRIEVLRGLGRNDEAQVLAEKLAAVDVG